MPFENAVLYYMLKSDKRVKKIRVTLIFYFQTGDRENRDYLFRTYPFPSVIFVQVFGKELPDAFKGAFFSIPVYLIGFYGYPISYHNTVNSVKEPEFLPG